ncbi:murein L,D-transpeptidase catalytic domain family protein [Prosthecochloris sp. HL-130-GSB]|jgi:hypothetical protein|uniref:murein L,D-transpeptidase catalytic domain family protein n=1 Tax=Prosthecochloris sp. HL-130-GSB TaxID=1974213 RepID=UPI000A1C0F26|nr:murein L,D-transpeptidase catalytic domain family protein [Prosthecochloris sp. HL-130-GSB]ARM31990.1 hypothetical protein B9H02_09520 [Prosthecochloris sp. HL-130-GSB]MBO8092835.1 murein L,D-transpeptidase catalytic domain family protein [Prosthecochloris sp.]
MIARAFSLPALFFAVFFCTSTPSICAPLISGQQAARLAGLPALHNSIDDKALRIALEGYSQLQQKGVLGNNGVLTIIDYNKPSVEERLFVIDVHNGRLLASSLVAHGRNSGGNLAERFSNVPGSYKSSPGFFVTGSTYQGKHGYSLRLKGLEQGINSNAEKRHIVIHGADYVSREFILRHGRLGRSLGCPALPPDTSSRLIDLIKEGSCVFIYNGDESYVNNSRVLNPGIALQKRQKASGAS